jgi:hypothetical protein
MNQSHQEDNQWRKLLQLAAPAFAGETELPYGFVTSTVARLKAERVERELIERIGLRALFAALAVLAVAGGVSLGVQLHDRLDFDPGTRSIIQEDNVSIS